MDEIEVKARRDKLVSQRTNMLHAHIKHYMRSVHSAV